MKKVYNMSEIMTRAWAIRKSAAAEIGCKASEVVFSECLKMAWAKAEGVNAEINASQIIGEWGDMIGEVQRTFMCKCIRKAAKNMIGYSNEDHYLQFSEVPAFSCYQLHDFDEFVSETCIRVIDSLDLHKLTAKNKKRATQGKRPITLRSIVYNAARASIAAVYYNDAKHSAAYDREIDDGEGNTASYLETMVESKHDNTEQSAIIRARLEQVKDGMDEIGRRVLEMLVAGKTEREIGKAVGISCVAVHKRIVKMRVSLEDLRTA